MNKNIKFSTQSLGAFMLLLQKCLAEESDIVPMLLDLNFVLREVDSQTDELVCLNPPVVYIPNGAEDGLEEEYAGGGEG